MLDRNFMGFLFAKSKFRAHSCWRLVVVFSILVCMVQLCWSDCNCYRGTCGADGVCDCDEGWTGNECDHCGGRTRLDSPTGTIFDSVGQYNTDTTCVWVVDSGRTGTSISLYLEAFATECSWDYLYIFDGDSIYAPLVAAFSGPIRYSDVNILHEVSTTSGYAYLYFYSDAAFKFEGFNITYRVDSCPMGCSGHGVCNPIFKNCSCDPLWTGEGCDTLACPANCSGNGECSISQQMCVCNPGYQGSDCRVLSGDGYWHLEESKAYGRASAAVVQQDNLVWVIGGYDFNINRNISIIRHHLDDGSSQEVGQIGDVPETRYSHTAVLYQDEIYIFGGSLHGRKVTDELLIYNVTSSTWVSNITYSGNPIAVEGHTSLVYEDTMVVMFGYSPKYSYISAVQEYNFSNKTWTVAQTTGAQVIGTYGHSSALDPIRNIVYVHAGFVDTSRQTDLTDYLYQYDLAKKEWRVLPSSNQPRFLHSAVILNDLMFVYGGNTHTDSVQYTGAKCFSNDFLAYRISCQSWSTIPSNTALPQDIARYGHASFVYDGKIFVYSGYTGVMQENILVYSPGNCSAHDNATLCLDTSPWLLCQWDVANDQCISSDQGNQFGLVPGNSSLQQCPFSPLVPQCTGISDCSPCQLTPGCGWCDSKCRGLSNCTNQDDIFCPSILCDLFTNCRTCNTQDGCKWNGNKCDNLTGGNPGSCAIPCDAFGSCRTCLGMEGCMWCTNQQRCIDSNSYITSFPYGLCWEWHTNYRNCPATNCSLLQTCDVCHADPHCGWCDSDEMTGLGTCIEGSQTGPLKIDQAGNPVLDLGLCPLQSWFYYDCPSCQCNGHSRCVNETTSICVNCQNNTTGPQCESCADGYYGNALNGGSCFPCQCNYHGTMCDSIDGRCFCNTKGVTGTYCERCENDQNYYGNAQNRGTCYYNLTMNFEYTFNLSSNDELYLTMINLMTSPEVNNRDIEFTLHVSKEINMNITYRTNDMPGVERQVVYQANTYYFTTTLSNSDYNFEEDANTTFFVYISNFTIPLTFKVAFKQVDNLSLVFYILIFFIITLVVLLSVMGLVWRFHQLYMNRVILQVSVRQRFLLLNLLEFLVVFFSCFLSFLLFFVVGWKVKQRCDNYHRQQVLFHQRSFNLVTVLVAFFVCFFVIIILFGSFLKLKDYWDRYHRQMNRAVELAVMARRPFASVNLVIENTVPPDIVAGTNKKHPLAFSMESCSDNKSQVATIFMQMPMPDGNKVPFGQTRFWLASALVQAKTKKGERRNSQQKQETRDPVRSETNVHNTSAYPIPPQDGNEPTDVNRGGLVGDRSQSEVYVIQSQLPASYDNAAMV